MCREAIELKAYFMVEYLILWPSVLNGSHFRLNGVINTQCTFVEKDEAIAKLEKKVESMEMKIASLEKSAPGNIPQSNFCSFILPRRQYVVINEKYLSRDAFFCIKCMVEIDYNIA